MIKTLKKIMIFLIVFSLFISGCSKNDSAVAPSQQKIKVFTTIYPLYDFTIKIAGNYADVESFIPLGNEPHGWEPSAQDLAALEKADLFIYNGAGMESWVKDVLNSIDQKNLQVVEATAGIPLVENHFEDTENHKQAEELLHQDLDPHVWLDPLLAKSLANNIYLGLVAKDPENQEVYERNYLNLTNELDKLNEEYSRRLSKVDKHSFVINHAAFGYLANRYGLEQIAVMGINPEAEPSIDKIVMIVKLVKENNLGYILSESLVSSKLSEILAKEAGIKVLPLNPLGGLTNEEMQAKKDYFVIMRDNLSSLVKALE